MFVTIGSWKGVSVGKILITFIIWWQNTIDGTARIIMRTFGRQMLWARSILCTAEDVEVKDDLLVKHKKRGDNERYCELK